MYILHYALCTIFVFKLFTTRNPCTRYSPLTCDFVASLVRVWGWASDRSLPFTVFFSLLALLFLELYRSFTMRVVWRFNETAQSFFVWGSSWASSAPCTRITCIQPLSRCSLPFSASSFFLDSFCSSSLQPYLLLFSFFFICGLLAWLEQPFLHFLSSSFVYIAMFCHQ